MAENTDMAIVYQFASRVLTNSVLVAKTFGRNHRDVLDSIRELVRGCAENSADPMFEESTYVHPQNGQEYPMFIMNRDGFTLLAMGFTGEKALKFKLEYIKAFNAMEAKIKQQSIVAPQTYAEALRRLADEVEARERTQLLLTEKTEQLDQSKEWYSIKRWAQIHRRNWRSYSWRKLKAVSHELGYAVKKIFDANYTEVNIYHRDVFEAVYGK